MQLGRLSVSLQLLLLPVFQTELVLVLSSLVYLLYLQILFELVLLVSFQTLVDKMFLFQVNPFRFVIMSFSYLGLS